MTLYNCAHCGMAMPQDRVPPPGAICFPCSAEERGRVSGVSRGYRELQERLAHHDPAFQDVRPVVAPGVEDEPEQVAYAAVLEADDAEE